MKNIYFITVSDGVITGSFYGDSTVKLTGFEDHEKIEVSEEVHVIIGEPVTFYTDWQRKTDKQLIDEGLIKLPEGYLLDGDFIREMTHEEKNPPEEPTEAEQTEQARKQAIAQLKTYLASTDYIDNKIVEALIAGADVEMLRIKYAAELQQRADTRTKINELES